MSHCLLNSSNSTSSKRKSDISSSGSRIPLRYFFALETASLGGIIFYLSKVNLSFPSGSPIVIHKSSQTGKSVILAGMPKPRPWTLTSRLHKCLIQATCQALVSRPWIQGHLLYSSVCHPWTLDSGIPDRNDGSPTLVYNGEIGSLGTSQKKL